MFNKLIVALKRTSHAESGCDVPNSSILLPRFWMVLLVLALPFFVICEGYFEALEQTGSWGAVIADIAFPASMISYLTLVFILKKRRI
jgi:hypothetical protein